MIVVLVLVLECSVFVSVGLKSTNPMTSTAATLSPMNQRRAGFLSSSSQSLQPGSKKSGFTGSGWTSGGGGSSALSSSSQRDRSGRIPNGNFIISKP